MMPITRLLRVRNNLLTALGKIEKKIALTAVQEGYTGYYEVKFEDLEELLSSQGENPYP